MSRVLLVDDEPAVCRALARVLREGGFETAVALDATSALAMMRETPFSVIVSDERMPGCSGVDLLEICAREHPEVTRVLLTGYADPQTAAEAINRAEIFRLLWKPWSDEEIVAVVRLAAWRNSLAVDNRTAAQPEPPSFDEQGAIPEPFDEREDEVTPAVAMRLFAV